MILKVLEVEVGTKNPSKIHKKRSSTWEGLLASIFHGFWWILEAKLSQVGMENRAKIHPKTHSKNSEKRKASWRRLGGRILGLQNSWDALVALDAGAVAETQGPLLGRIPEGLEY